jgi:hypothetical protein
MFVCVVVLLAADARDGGPPRSARELLRGARSALGPLLLVGIIAGIALVLVSSLAPLLLVMASTILFTHLGIGILPFLLALLLVPTLGLLPQLLLLTSWSVIAPIAVIERPGRLRALRRSRELARGNRWRVFGLILMLTIPLGLIASVLGAAAQAAGDGPAIAVGLLTGTLIAPIPVLAATALYFEMLRGKATLASLEPRSPGELPADTTLS